MKKVLRKLMPTIFLLLVAAFMLGTSTLAWFTTNTAVTASGMKIKLEADDNLLIAPDVDGLSSNNENTFKNALTMTPAALKLAPVSSVDGRSYFYVEPRNATAAGNVINEKEYLPYAPSAFSAAYKSAAGYSEYRFQLKAMTGTVDLERALRLTDLDLSYIGDKSANTSLIKAFRIAVFMEGKPSEYPEHSDPNVTGFTAANAATIPASESYDPLKAVYAPTGAEFFTEGKAVSATDALSAVEKLNKVAYSAEDEADRQLDILGRETVRYYKVSVRIWLEGEDTTCNNESFVVLDDDWELKMTFTLGNASGAGSAENVDSLGLWNNVKITKSSSGVLKAALVNGKTEASYEWYRNGSAISDTDSPTYLPTEAGSYYCIIKAYDDTYYTTNEIVV